MSFLALVISIEGVDPRALRAEGLVSPACQMIAVGKRGGRGERGAPLQVVYLALIFLVSHVLFVYFALSIPLVACFDFLGLIFDGRWVRTEWFRISKGGHQC